MSIPFLKGSASDCVSRAHKLIYGRRRESAQQMKREKPELAGLLLHASPRDMVSLMQTAHVANEATPDVLSSVLTRLRSYGRFDRGLAAARAYESVTGSKLRASHFTLLMALALSAPASRDVAHVGIQGGWREALRLFDVGFVRRQHPLSSPSVGAAFAACRAGGLWARSTALFARVMDDKVELESKAVHALVKHLRVESRWDLALRVFDVATSSGTRPDYLLYRELLQTISDASSRVPGAWRFALIVAAAIEPVCPPNAGIYNCLIETCANACLRLRPTQSGAPPAIVRHRMWEAGLNVFRHFQERVIRSALLDHSSRTVVNSQTITALAHLRANNPEHLIRCHALGRSHGLPIAADVFHLLFVSLDNARRSEEGLAFAQRSLDDAVDDASNAGLALQPLLLGLLDSLARHPRPRSARVAAQHLRSSLQPIVSTACGGCAVWGDESQSWVVDGGCRVAVIDAVALAYPRVFDVLLESYDAVMIPFTAVRAMLRRLETEPPNSPGATSVLTALDALMQAQLKPPPMVSARGGRGPPQQAGAGPVQVMPFIHHLSALELIAPDTTDATVGTRSVAESDAGALRSLLDAASAAGRGDGAGGVLPAPRYCVLPGAASLEEHSALRGEGSVAPPGGSGSGFFSAQPPIVASSSQKRQQPRKGDAKPRASQPSPTITANSHAAAVALLLKRLNPDADVTVLCGHHGLPYCKAAGVECISFRDFIYSRRGRTGAHGKLPSDADAARRLVSGGGSLSLAPSASVPSDAALASREDASRSSSLALAATSPASATPASSRRAVVADFSDYQLDDEDDAATTPAMREAERTARTMPS